MRLKPLKYQNISEFKLAVTYISLKTDTGKRYPTIIDFKIHPKTVHIRAISPGSPERAASPFAGVFAVKRGNTKYILILLAFSVKQIVFAQFFFEFIAEIVGGFHIGRLGHDAQAAAPF